MSSGGQANAKGGQGGQSTSGSEPAFNCTFCGNLYTEPRVIPCGHIYCAPCLNKHFEAARQEGKDEEGGGEEDKKQQDDLDQVNSCPCPTNVCSEPIELVTGDASQFPKSFILEKLVQLERYRQMDLRCSNCAKTGVKDPEPATKYCKNCGDWFCSTCAAGHTRTMKTKEHQLVDASEGYRTMSDQRTRSERCPEHPDKQCNMYCTPCERLICEMCYMIAHKQHRGVLEIERVKTRLRSKLVGLQKNVKGRMAATEKYRQNLNESSQKNLKAESTIGDQIDALCDELKENVEKVRELAKKAVEDRVAELNEQNSGHNEKIDDRLQLLKRLSTCLERTIDEATAAEMYFASQDVEGYLQVLDDAPYSTKSAFPPIHVVTLRDQPLTQLLEGSRMLRQQLEQASSASPGGETTRSGRDTARGSRGGVVSTEPTGGASAQLVESEPFKPELASVSTSWFRTRTRYDANKVQIRSVCYREQRKSFLVADIWNKGIKEFSEKGEFLCMWETKRGWPLAIAELRTGNKSAPLAVVEFDVSLKQCYLAFYNARSQLMRSMPIPIAGLYIGSICVTNKNLVAVPNHDERRIHFFSSPVPAGGGGGGSGGEGDAGDAGVSEPDPPVSDRHLLCLEGTIDEPELEIEGRTAPRLPTRLPGRPEFLAYSRTDGRLIASCPADRVVLLLKGTQLLRRISAHDAALPNWRPYCVAAGARDGRFVVQDGLHPDQDQLLLFAPDGSLARLMPQDRVWIRLAVDAHNRLVLNDKQNVAIYVCQWMNTKLKKKEGKQEEEGDSKDGESAEEAKQQEVEQLEQSHREMSGARCEKHSNKSIDLYCRDCKEYLCNQCALLTHRNHHLDDLLTAERCAGAGAASGDAGGRDSATGRRLVSARDGARPNTPPGSGPPRPGSQNERARLRPDPGKRSPLLATGETNGEGGASGRPGEEAGYRPSTYLSNFTRPSEASKAKLAFERFVVADRLGLQAIEFDAVSGKQIRSYGQGTSTPLMGKEPAAGVVLNGAEELVLLIERISEIKSVAVFYRGGRLDHSVDFTPTTALNPSSICVGPKGSILVPAGVDPLLYVYDSGCATVLQRVELEGLAEYVAWSARVGGVVALAVPDDGLVLLLRRNERGEFATYARLRADARPGGAADWAPKALCFTNADLPANSGGGLGLVLYEEDAHALLAFALRGDDATFFGVLADNVENCEQLALDLDDRQAFCASHNGVRRYALRWPK